MFRPLLKSSGGSVDDYATVPTENTVLLESECALGDAAGPATHVDPRGALGTCPLPHSRSRPEIQRPVWRAVSKRRRRDSLGRHFVRRKRGWRNDLSGRPSECLYWLLVLNAEHLSHALRVFIDH